MSKNHACYKIHEPSWAKNFKGLFTLPINYQSWRCLIYCIAHVMKMMHRSFEPFHEPLLFVTSKMAIIARESPKKRIIQGFGWSWTVDFTTRFAFTRILWLGIHWRASSSGVTCATNDETVGFIDNISLAFVSYKTPTMLA